MSTVCHQVEGLRLHVRRFHSSPFQVIPFKHGIWRRLSLFCNGLDRRWAIDWLWGTSDIRQPLLSVNWQKSYKMIGNVRCFSPVHHPERMFWVFCWKVVCGKVKENRNFQDAFQKYRLSPARHTETWGRRVRSNRRTSLTTLPRKTTKWSVLYGTRSWR